MDFGAMMEPAALKDADEHFTLQGFSSIVQLGSLQHSEFPLLQGEPDGVMIHPFDGSYVPIEVKCRCYPEITEAMPFMYKEDVP